MVNEKKEIKNYIDGAKDAYKSLEEAVGDYYFDDHFEDDETTRYRIQGAIMALIDLADKEKDWYAVKKGIYQAVLAKSMVYDIETLWSHISYMLTEVRDIEEKQEELRKEAEKWNY